MGDELKLYKIDPGYLDYLHDIDNRISTKFNGRPFVGLITMINEVTYVLPLTSQTTQERKKSGKRRRSAMITTFIRDSAGEEIANILHNNMFPVRDGAYTELKLDPEVDTYEMNEIRYIRKHSGEIISKAKRVYAARTENPNDFLEKTCCDFKRLESRYIMRND